MVFNDDNGRCTRWSEGRQILTSWPASEGVVGTERDEQKTTATGRLGMSELFNIVRHKCHADTDE